jgi:hypothetical protein
VGVGISRQSGKDDSVQEVPDVDHRQRRPLADQAETILKGRTAFLLILSRRGKAKSLAEILLVKALSSAVIGPSSATKIPGALHAFSVQPAQVPAYQKCVSRGSTEPPPS